MSALLLDVLTCNGEIAMTAKLKFTFGMADKDIVAGITSVGKRHKSLYADIQFLSVSIIHAFHTSGDGQTACRRANDLIKALAGGKQNALRRWFETQAPMVYNKETKELVVGHSPASPVKDYKKINALAAITDRNINDIVEEALSAHLDKFGRDELIQQFLDIKTKATKKTTKK